MRPLFTILLFIYFSPTHSLGQLNKRINIPKDRNGDTVLWYKWQHEKDGKLKLPHLITSTEQFHFRFWGNKQVVDIWTNDNKLFYGVVINYIEKFTGYNKKTGMANPYKMLFSQSLLDTSLARKVSSVIKPIRLIPTEDSIEKWSHGEYSVEYIFEASTPANYSFKTYWSPEDQDTTLKETKLICRFIRQMEDTLHLKEKYEVFFAALKPGSYDNGDASEIIKFSDRQNRLWKKDEPNRRYLDSVKDTLNNYLNHRLTKIFNASSDSFPNSSDYFIKLSAHNKVKKVKTNMHFYSFSDRQEFHMGRRKVKNAFKQIPITFVDSKRAYWKTFNYWDGKALIH